MKVNCLHCGVELPAENLNITLALAKCSQCHHLFNFANPSGELSVPQPQRFQVNRAGNELTISWRWYEHQLWFMLLFCILWDGFLITWYGALLTCWNGKFELIMLLPILFPLGHVAVGVGLTYSVLMGFFNKTVIRVTAEGEVIVRHGPLPWCGNCRLSRSEITQLYCTEKYRRSSRSTQISFTVNLFRSNQTNFKLIADLPEIEEALFIEQQIEQALRIENQLVPGEVRDWHVREAE